VWCVPKLSNDTSLNDLEWSLIQISRSRYYSTSNKCIGDDMKGAARRIRNRIKNTNIRSAFITEILWKTASSHKISLQWYHIKNRFWPQLSSRLPNRLLSCGQKRFLIWRTSAILNFNNIWSRDCHRVPNVLLCTKFRKNRMVFRWHMVILRFTICLPSAILNFRNWDIITWP